MIDYKKGLSPLCEAGVVRPRGPFVLVRAIMQTDTSELAKGITVDTQEAIAHEVLACGQSVGDLMVGDHVFIRTKAADKMSTDDKDARFWVVHQEDIMASWPNKAIDP